MRKKQRLSGSQNITGAKMLKRNDQISPANANDRSDALVRENLHLKARVAELERLATIDTLTPRFNRRYLMQELDRWCWRAHRYGGTFGLLYLDVDRLKQVNDTHGHVAGDNVLCAIADAWVSDPQALANGALVQIVFEQGGISISAPGQAMQLRRGGGCGREWPSNRGL